MRGLGLGLNCQHTLFFFIFILILFVFQAHAFTKRSNDRLQASSHQENVTSKRLQAILRRAHQCIERDEGKLAYDLIRDELKKQETAELDLIAAQSMASLNNPGKSLYFYQQALKLSSNSSEKIIALFGVAKMQFWLNDYTASEKTYRLLLAYYPLNPMESELALAGIVRTLAYNNRPRLAYCMIPKQFKFTTPELLVAAAQASSWAGWSDITKNMLTVYQPLRDKINPNAVLGKNLRDLQWQTKLATSPNVVTPSFFYSHDSEDFNKRRTTLDYSHYWNQAAQTGIGLDYIDYNQNSLSKLNARGVYVTQTIKPTRSFTFKGLAEPTIYQNLTPGISNHWTPFLWGTNAAYTPSDTFSIQALALKEIVETFPAFAHKITDNQYGGSVILSPLPRLQLNGTYYQLDISDQNVRNGYFLSSSVLLLPNFGLSAMGIVRGFTDKFTSPYYFSPHQYTTGSVLFKVGRKLGASWHYYVDGGAGRQFIVSQPGSPVAASPTYEWGLGISGPICSWITLNAYFVDTRQASPFIDSPDYHYQYGGISLNILL